MADPRLAALASLPGRTFPDIAEPRRAVLDEVAARSLAVSITVTELHRRPNCTDTGLH